MAPFNSFWSRATLCPSCASSSGLVWSSRKGLAWTKQAVHAAAPESVYLALYLTTQGCLPHLAAWALLSQATSLAIHGPPVVDKVSPRAQPN